MHVAKVFKFYLVSFIAAALLFLTASSCFADVDEKAFSAAQKRQIEGVVHDYLIANPEILIEVSMALKHKQMDDMKINALKVAKENAKTIFSTAHSPAIGNPEGKITIVEFYDYYCPHCRDMELILADLMKSNKEIRVVEKILPIFGERSQFAAKIALAADMQNKFDKMQAILMNSKNISLLMSADYQQKVYDLAQKAGLNVKKLKDDMINKAISAEIDANYALAGKLLPNQIATPIFIVGKSDLTDKEKIKFFVGAVEKEKLNAAIKGLGA